MNKNKIIITKHCILILLAILEMMPCFSQRHSDPVFETPPVYFHNILPGDKIFASPEVVAFQRINFLPANLYTGKININIPIFEIKTGNINVPISLSYNASGIKVDEYASNVGTGWNLNAGGNIIRIVKDLEDHYNRSRSVYQETNYNEFERIGARNTVGFLNKKTSYSGDEDERIDASPDLFIANAPGLSTQFNFYEKHVPNILDGNGVKINNITYNKFTLDNDLKGKLGFKDHLRRIYKNSSNQDLSTSDYSIIVDHENILSSNLEISDYKSFDIQNINGLKYSFNSFDLIETTFSFYKISTSIYDQETSYERMLSAWHLDKIEDESTNRKVNFIYDKKINLHVNEKMMSIFHQSYEKNDKNGAFSHIPECTCWFSPFVIHPDYKSQKIFSKNTQTNRIKQISWDGGYINFEYNLERKDAYEQEALTDIYIKDVTGNIIKHFSFLYSYLESGDYCNDPECKRLILTGIEQISKDKKIKLYSFDYVKNPALPKVGSIQQDYLGFYNKNGAEIIIDKSNIETPSNPLIYYQKGKENLSILPFKLDDSYIPLLDTGKSLEANGYSLTGVLDKITYPTGGTAEFEYENHKFLFEGKELTAGGTRIKSQILNNGKGKKEVYTYTYTDAQGKTSGSICNIPIFGRINYVVYKNKKKHTIQFELYNRGRSEVELTDGSFVGYSRIIEKQEGNGYKEYIYSSPKEYPNVREVLNTSINKSCTEFIRNNSLYPGLVYQNNDIFRGKLKQEIIWNSNNQKIKEMLYDYQYKLFSSKNVKFFNEFVTGGYRLDPFKYYKYEANITINNERNLLSNIKSKEYFDSNTLENTVTYRYDETYPLLKDKTLVDSHGNTRKYQYDYPSGLQSDTVLGNSASLLFAKNRLETALRYGEYTGVDLVTRSYTLYESDKNSNNLLLPKSVYSQFGKNAPIERDGIINNYDPYGNPLSFTKKEDQTVLLWSYNGQYPIAEIKNATYEQVRDALGGQTVVDNIAKSTTFSDTDKSKIDNLRSNTALPNALVTTYTYKPLVGILTATDPSSITTYYEYDSFNRLKRTYIKEGTIEKTIQQYNYHYQNQ